jgi:pimeloyl-ACP methyl ester carboxylesterase
VDAAGYFTMPDGIRLYFEQVGSGDQTILVPARLFLRRDLAVPPLAAAGRRLVFYDMRNRGRSDAVADHTTLTIGQDVADLETVRGLLNAERVSLIGYSYLGRMVAMYAAAHPDRVERIAQLGAVPMALDTEYPAELTMDQSPDPRDQQALAAVRALREKNVQYDRPREYCEREWAVTRVGLFGDPARAAALDSPCDQPNEWPVNLARHFQFHFGSLQAHPPFGPEELKRVGMPVLTVHGTRDRNAPYGGGREWALRLPDARLLTVEGAGHHLSGEAQQVVLPALAAFFAGGWPEAAEKVTTLVPN